MNVIMKLSPFMHLAGMPNVYFVDKNSCLWCLLHMTTNEPITLCDLIMDWSFMIE